MHGEIVKYFKDFISKGNCTLDRCHTIIYTIREHHYFKIWFHIFSVIRAALLSPQKRFFTSIRVGVVLSKCLMYLKICWK